MSSLAHGSLPRPSIKKLWGWPAAADNSLAQEIPDKIVSTNHLSGQKRNSEPWVCPFNLESLSAALLHGDTPQIKFAIDEPGPS